MSAPNFTAVLAGLRDQQDMTEYRRQRRQKWLARPLTEREEVIQDNLMHALRGMDSEFKADDVVEDVHDHWSDAEGMAELRELLEAVAEKDSGKAWEVLKKALGTVAKFRRERELT